MIFRVRKVGTCGFITKTPLHERKTCYIMYVFEKRTYIAYKIAVRKPQEKRPFGRSRRRYGRMSLKLILEKQSVKRKPE
jgi:hypothetical protein